MTATRPPPLSLTDLSLLPLDAFTAELDGIFEHSPWVARGAWPARPFDSVQALHDALLAVLKRADHPTQLALIRAHPELAGQEAAHGTLTAASTQEQHGAGLNQCSPAELARLRTLNASYRARFGYPFIIAVKGLSRYQIMDAMQTRLHNDHDTELANCLAEIGKIARFRLDSRYS